MTDQRHDPGSGEYYPDIEVTTVEETAPFAEHTSADIAVPASSPAHAYESTSTTGGGATDAVKDVAGHASERVGEVKDTAVAKAAEVKDTALDRGADVAAVAKDELEKLAGEARTHAQALWSQTAVQLREQADTGRHQLADLLHALSSELGEMASKSTQDGPVTAFAKQAAARGGALGHWLANTEPSDILNDVRRFARRRPWVFLGGAAVAGVVVGRLGRGLMAVSQDASPEPTHAITSDLDTPASTTGSTTVGVGQTGYAGYGTTATPVPAAGELR